jgi:hypothetical protein
MQFPNIHPSLNNHDISFTLSPQAQQEVAAGLATLAACAAAGQVRDVGVPCQHLRNVLLGLDSPDHDQAVTALGHGLGDGVCGLGFTLGADDVGLTLLLGLLDNEARALGLLLCNLLLLDGLCELLAEGHVGDGDVLEGNVELAGALEQVCADFVGDGLALGDELGGVELGDDGLEDFVTDGGEDTLIVVEAEVLVAC